MKEHNNGPLGQRPKIIGIAGGTGSGKTTVAKLIVESIPDDSSVLIEHDWYYKDCSHIPSEERDGRNYDEPAALDNDLLINHLTALRNRQTIEAPQYDFASHSRKKESLTIKSCHLIIVEGILTFSIPALRDMFDLRLFVDTDDDIRLMRRIKRDIINRGRDIESIQKQYYDTVRPMHRLHVASVKEHAHLIIPEGGKNRPAIDVIVDSLRHALSSVA